MKRRHLALMAAGIAVLLTGTRAEAQVPDSGTLVLTVMPEATVFVDRNQVGTFRSRSLVMPVGRYVITFNHPDYQPLRRTIDLAANEKKVLTIDLEEKGVPHAPAGTNAGPGGAKPTTPNTTAKPNIPTAAPAPASTAAGTPRESSLRVRVEPRAQITIDGRLIGETSDLTVPLTPGRHIVQVVHPQYQPLQRTVTVTDGATSEVSINLAVVGKKK